MILVAFIDTSVPTAILAFLIALVHHELMKVKVKLRLRSQHTDKT